MKILPPSAGPAAAALWILGIGSDVPLSWSPSPRRGAGLGPGWRVSMRPPERKKRKLCSARGPQWISSPKILFKCGVDSLQGASRNPRMPGNRFALAHKAAYRRLGTPSAGPAAKALWILGIGSDVPLSWSPSPRRGAGLGPGWRVSMRPPSTKTPKTRSNARGAVRVGRAAAPRAHQAPAPM